MVLNGKLAPLHCYSSSEPKGPCWALLMLIDACFNCELFSHPTMRIKVLQPLKRQKVTVRKKLTREEKMGTGPELLNHKWSQGEYEQWPCQVLATSGSSNRAWSLGNGGENEEKFILSLFPLPESLTLSVCLTCKNQGVWSLKPTTKKKHRRKFSLQRKPSVKRGIIHICM